MTTQTLQRAALYGALAAVLTIILATVWSYPDWMWAPLVLTMLAGIVAAVASAGELLRRRLFAAR